MAQKNNHDVIIFNINKYWICAILKNCLVYRFINMVYGSIIHTDSLVVVIRSNLNIYRYR